MDFAKTAILTGGILSFGVAAGHSLFYRVFGWKSDLEKISILNRKILYTIHIFLTIFFLIFATISILFAAELSTGKGIAGGLCFGYALLWIIRLIWQIAYFRPSEIPHNRNLLIFHCFLIFLFAFLSLCYFAPLAQRFLSWLLGRNSPIMRKQRMIGELLDDYEGRTDEQKGLYAPADWPALWRVFVCPPKVLCCCCLLWGLWGGRENSLAFPKDDFL